MDGLARDLDLRSFLAAVEEPSPLEAVEVLSAELVTQLGAHHARLLIANFSGSGLVRLTHVGAGGPTAEEGRNKRAEHVPLPGTSYERALWSQTVEVTGSDNG